MVYKDYVFLQRWYDYYRKQIGAENIFVLSHGNDPQHRRIAYDANVINVPRDPSLFKFDRRRWRMMGSVASGMLEFYNWMIVSDVDEFVVVDPLASSGIVNYLQENYGRPETAQANISPLGLDLIHIPEEEPHPIEPKKTILSCRRIFRPNSNYSKPCIVSAPVIFGPGGHRNNLGLRHMPKDLYLIHLKYSDFDTLKMRDKLLRQIVTEANALNSSITRNHSFGKALKGYMATIENATLMGEEIELTDFRNKMNKQVEKYSNQFIWGKATTKNLYRLPERFSDIF